MQARRLWPDRGKAAFRCMSVMIVAGSASHLNVMLSRFILNLLYPPFPDCRGRLTSPSEKFLQSLTEPRTATRFGGPAQPPGGLGAPLLTALRLLWPPEWPHHAPFPPLQAWRAALAPLAQRRSAQPRPSRARPLPDPRLHALSSLRPAAQPGLRPIGSSTLLRFSQRQPAPPLHWRAELRGPSWPPLQP